MSKIRSIDRAFTILRAVSTAPDGIGVNSVAQQVGLAKSTTSRILSALEEWNTVERTADNRFKIGPGLVRLVENQPFSATLKALVRPALQQIAAETGEATLLVVNDGSEALYLDMVAGSHAVQVRDWTGERVPFNVTSGGKMLLAHADETFTVDYLSKPLARLTAHSVDDAQKLAVQLKTIKERGFAVTDGEYDDEVAGITVPVKNVDGIVIAAITVYGPTFRLRPFARRTEVLEVMQSAVSKLMIDLQA
ncbi:MAG: DNA-binding IclR family transcriptional regulator [Cellvibrionaceae bacterium]|jgi:DNA-binding IclR family transcriptional regulator